MLEKKFSIIVVSLNTKINFIKTLESIKTQTYKNFEVIVIDGESTDGTIDEILKQKNSLINLFKIEKDEGIYDAMNKGVILSSGKWTIFLNSGDIFANPNVLKNISEENLENYEVVFGDTIINTKSFKFLSEGNFFNENTITMPFCHQSVLVKSKIIKETLFDIKYKLSADFGFFFNQISKKRKFKKINIIVSEVISEGVSDKNRLTVLKDNYKIISKKNNLVKIKFFFLFLYFIFGKIIKFVLPNAIINCVLRFKYNKSIIYKKHDEVE